METASVKSETVDVVEVTPEYAVVEAKGTSLDIPNVQVNRNFTIEANQEWITAKTVFKNTGNESQTFWIGDAIDYDGSGQRSAAGNKQVITLPYSTPRAFTLNEPWIGMTGNDKQ